jgi:DNA polymerase III sliding clamp (beta) subunit (PCNA family)
MKTFNVKATEARDALAVAVVLAGKKTPHWELNNVRLSVESDKVTVFATDGDNTVNITVAKSGGDYVGELIVNCEEIYKSIEKAKSVYAEIKFGVDEKTLTMKQESGLVTNFALADGEKYPVTNVLPVANARGILSVDKIKHVAKEVLPFAVHRKAGELEKGALEGVLLSLSESGLRFVATDADKLNVCEYNGIQAAEGNGHDVVLTPDFLTLAEKIANTYYTNGDSLLGYMLSEESEYIVLRGKGFSLMSRTCGEKYPNWEKVVSDYRDANDKEATIDKERLIKSVESVKRSERVIFVFSVNRLMIVSEDTEAKTAAKIEIPANYTGKRFVIGFKAKILLDTLKRVGSAECVFSMSENTRGVIIRDIAESKFRKEYKLLMPIRLSSDEILMGEEEMPEIRQIEYLPDIQAKTQAKTQAETQAEQAEEAREVEYVEVKPRKRARKAA